MGNSVTEQLDLFTPSRWPRKPYCSDDKTAKWIRQLKSAIKHPYIQANPPHLRVWSIYDIDEPMAAFAWEDAILPPPTWNAIRKANGHAHTAYGYRAPVLVDSPDMRQAPLRYLCAIEAGFRAKLGADRGYSGLMTKNPIHPDWHTLTYGGPDLLLYDLDDLVGWVDLPKFLPKRGKNPEEIGVGRNCTLFDDLRKWAYRRIRDYKSLGIPGWNPWQSACYAWALERNGDFDNPMDSREVWHVSKSVTRWTWRRFEVKDWQDDLKWRAKQAHRGKMGGVAKGAANEDKRSSAVLMRAKGMAQTDIAKELGVSRETIRLWLRGEE